MSLISRQINHTWPSSGIQCCVNVSLEIKPGRIHALVGENGAGKTTLGHILAGVRPPDTGMLTINGMEIDLHTNSGRAIPGTGLVRQRSIWPTSLKLWEATILGREKRFQRPSTYIDHFCKLADQWQFFEIDPLGRVGDQDAVTLQHAQLIAALMTNPEYIIFDEPVTAWGEGRIEDFIALLGRLKQVGMGILLITHRLTEVFRIADNLTVLKNGRVLSQKPINSLDMEEVSTLLSTGEEEQLSPERVRMKGDKSHSIPMPLRCENIHLVRGKKELLNMVSFSVNAGEILCITGRWKEGLTHLEGIISGEISPNSGKVLLSGHSVKGGMIGVRQAGLGYVPSDAIMRGTSLTSTLGENLIVLEAKKLSHRGWLPPKTIHQWALKHCIEAGIEGTPGQRMDELSGGNIQKLILKRELEFADKVLLLADPVMGLDTNNRKAIHHKLRKMAGHGTAILVLTPDVDEALEIADRLAVLSRGKLSPVKPADSWNRKEINSRTAGLWEDDLP